MVSGSLLHQHHELRSGELRSSHAGVHSWTIYVRGWKASPSVRTGLISDLLPSWAKMTRWTSRQDDGLPRTYEAAAGHRYLDPLQ